MINTGSRWRMGDSRICKTPIARLMKTIKWNVLERRLLVLFAVAVIGGFRIPPMEMRHMSNPALKIAFWTSAGATCWGGASSSMLGWSIDGSTVMLSWSIWGSSAAAMALNLIASFFWPLPFDLWHLWFDWWYLKAESGNCQETDWSNESLCPLRVGGTRLVVVCYKMASLGLHAESGNCQEDIKWVPSP